ncbi:hypothetical protein B7760_03640 [Burkholderia glumae]|nr:hypothetical protein KS03_4427 [Burkholderia glumae LMG 2196 = ATCC 33617]QKM49582.1 hypothetical protein B7760_03640 [Burkholderia glumae]QKM56243.1 hypothetical protein CG017_04307 [Burkholderia glumae]QTP36607.1 hypothetical protein B7759_05245 [Burkholderia glumae]
MLGRARCADNGRIEAERCGGTRAGMQVRRLPDMVGDA